ncbi:hypothetical protein Plhal304r1_c008g0033661 [Plasmopara halstedii]
MYGVSKIFHSKKVNHMVVKVHCEVPCPRGVYIVTDAAGTETICVLRENGGCLMNTVNYFRCARIKQDID